MNWFIRFGLLSSTMHRLTAIAAKTQRTILGINSGTSMDSIDLAMVRVSGHGLGAKIDPLEHDAEVFPDEMRSLLANLPFTADLEEATRANVALGHLFADAVHTFVQKKKLRIEEIDAIGSHGQTVGHFPEQTETSGIECRASLQIGDPSVIAVKTGVPTVGDFRMADIAAGGSGAPLMPYFDFVFLRDEKISRGVLNIGGIANLTILRAGSTLDKTMAWDTGPGNMLLDGISRHFFEEPYDQDGSRAAKGKCMSSVLDDLLRMDYFSKSPPKSTGREGFGNSLLERLLKKHTNVAPADWLTTFTEFTARSIYDEYKRWSPVSVDELLVSGGGVYNTYLLMRLQSLFGKIPVRSIESFGIPPTVKEPMLFAFLANECLMDVPANLPNVTGASGRVVLGKICL